MFNQVDHIALATAQKAVDPAHDRCFGFADAVQLTVIFRVMGAVEQEIEQTRADHLTALRQQKLLQVVVSQRRVFDINLSDHADLDLLLIAALHPIKAFDDAHHQLGDLLPAQQLFAEQLFCPKDALLHRLLAGSLLFFIRDALVVQGHNQIAAQHPVERL